MTKSEAVIVGLVQINNSFSGQNYLPYSIGCLQGYVEKNAADQTKFKFLLPLYKRTPIQQAVDHLASADIVGISLYVWNARISLEIARRLKKENPNVLIVVGGPHIPDDAESFLNQHTYLDVAIHGEGEKPFLQLLEKFPDRNWSGINSLSHLNSGGVFTKTDRALRMRSLEQIESPFLSGVFEPLMRENPDEVWIGLWETNRGCPFQCTFCDWGSATATKINQFELARLQSEIQWFADNHIEYIFCCDANFGILPRDIEIANLVAETKRTMGYPHALSVQNTKNATERAYITQKILSDAGLNKGVALSMQSIDETTLKNIKRDNISLETYLELQRRFTQDGVETYSDLILGLPGETYESFVNGVSQLIETGQHNRIQFNNLSILPNAEMGDPQYIEKFKMEIVETEIINIHGAREQLDDDVPEIQQLVVSTYSMPRSDWRKTRRFAWTAALFYFDKILQIPLMLGHHISGLSYRHMLEALMNVDRANYPELGKIQDFFEEKAADLQQGGSEYCYSAQWLGIYWPMDEYVFIQMISENRLDAFYDEAHNILKDLISRIEPQLSQQAIDDAFELNRHLICRPDAVGIVDITTGYDILEICDAIRSGIPVNFIPKPTTTRINRSSRIFLDFDQWCREIVWWGNKKGAYLYTGKSIEKELAGHF